MSDLTTYRQATTEEVNDATEGHGSAQLRWVLPDTRLQAIADAWDSPEECAAWTTAAKARVRVAHPGVAALLDALVGDTDE